MKRSILILAAVASMSSLAFADDAKGSGSEYQHQAGAGKMEVTPALSYMSSTMKANTTTTSNLSKIESTATTLSAAGEYGINDMFSAGLMLGYTTGSMKYSFTPTASSPNTSVSGLTDLDLYGRGRMDNVGPGSLHFGLDLAIATGNRKVDNTATSSKANASSGGMTITPAVGYEMAFGPHTVGARLAYSMLLSEAKTTTTNTGVASDSSVTGGQQVNASVFWEMPMAPVTLGAALGFVSQSATSTKAGTPAVTTGDSNSNSGVLLTLYAPWDAAPNVLLLPSLSYGHVSSMQATNESSNTGFNLNVGARFTF